MKRRWLALAVAALFAANPAVAAPPAADAQSFALALRYIAATGGMYEIVRQQAYAVGGLTGDSPTSHARQQALLDAADRHRAELSALDLKLASLLTQTFTVPELAGAVNFLESPSGRSITVEKSAYFAAPFARDRPALVFSAEETAALAAYDATPAAISMKAKTPAFLAQTLALSAPVQHAISLSARKNFCRATRRCNSDDSGFDEFGGPNITRP